MSTQSATAEQLTPGRLPIAAVSRFFKWLTASAPYVPTQQRGAGAKAGSTKAQAGAGHAPGVGVGQEPAAGSGLAKVTPGISGGVAHGFDAKTSKWMASKSTARTSWWQNADGTQTEKISTAPANYKTAQGWEPIDSSLTANATGGWSQKANDFGLHIASSTSTSATSSAGTAADAAYAGHARFVNADAASSDASSSGSDLATLTYAAGESFGWSLSGAATVIGNQDGNTVTYTSILPETNLSLTSESWGVKETLSLASSAAASSWTFPLTMTGLTLSETSAGVWQLADSTGTAVAVLPAPYAYDAAGAQTQSVAYGLSTVGGVEQLTMTLDSSWLADTARVFPVTVDPSVSDPGSETSAYVSYLNKGQNYGTSSTLGVGYNSSGDTQHAYITYPSGVAMTGYHITAAGLTAFMTSGSTSSTYPFSVYAAADAWSPSAITWSNASISYISKLGTYAGQVVNSGPCGGASGSWINTALDATVLSQFADGQYAWNGMFLMADNESTTAAYRQFDSTEVSACSPYLFLTYTPDVYPTLSTMQPAPNTSEPTLTPELTASGTDSDAWPDSSVKFEFYLSSANGTQIDKSGLLTTGAWRIPSGDLKWGNTYQWQVCVWDGWHCQSSLTANTFETIAPGPMLTEDLSQSTDGHGFDAQSGDYTAAATDADVAGVGPALSVIRDYNSLNDSHAGAFGTGWSSMLDASVTQGLDTTGALMEAAVTYPDGSLAAFGLDSDGVTYSPPEGRYATLNATTSGSTVTGYTLTDKSGTTYTFGHVITAPVTGQGAKNVPGKFGLTQITDHQGRALNFQWQIESLSRQFDDSGALGTQTLSFERIGTITNMVNGRYLSVYWTWPNVASGEGISIEEGTSQPHVAEVVTNEAQSGATSTEQVWTYAYNADELSSVCAPSQGASALPSTACTKYAYENGSVYRQAVLDGSPYQYWPLSDVSSNSSNSGLSLVDANVGVGRATYGSVTADGSDTPSPTSAIGSKESSAVFNGTDSNVALSSGMLVNSTYVSVGLWFKTTASGPLFCEQSSAIDSVPTNATCSLYVGTDGKLRGEWYDGSAAPITSSGTVNDGHWHFVVLSGEGTTQSLYLDGAQVGTLPGNIDNLGQFYEYAGAGYSSAVWPDSGAKGNWFFTGSIADVAVYKQGVPAAEVSSLYTEATTQAADLTTIIRPDAVANSSEKPATQVVYDHVSGRVQSVTDANGGLWTLSAPSVAGSGQIFRESVMAQSPAYYYRLEDTSGTYPVDEVNADAWYDPSLAAQYSANVTLGADGTVFGDGTTAAGFTASKGTYVQLPNAAGDTAPESIGLWFKSGASGPLYCMQNAALSGTPTAATCPLYIGSTGKLYGGWYMGALSNIASSHVVDDGKWHYAVLAASSTSQSLYLDGALVGTDSGTFNADGQALGYLGAGYSSAEWPGSAPTGDWYYTGDLADAAIFHSTLSQAQVTTLWQAYNNTVGSIVPLETVTVTDPAHTATGTSGGGSTETYAYDPAHDGRGVSYTDAFGGKTTYGYDVNGFLDTATDPNGDTTTTGHDARGNVVSTTTCQNQTQNLCETSYSTYYWSANGLKQNTTDVRADELATSSDGRSTSASDPTYRTSYTYDGSGDELSSTDPDLNKTTNTYTDGTATYPACDPTSAVPGTKSSTQNAPPGLLHQTVTAGGATTVYEYYPDGDTCEVIDADHLETFFTYDGLGRVLTKTVTGSPVVPAGMAPYTGTLTTTYTYDGDGRVVETDAPPVTDQVTGTTHTAVTTQCFDADGNVTSTTVWDTKGGDYSRTTSYTYNGYDQKASQTAAEGNTAVSTANVTSCAPPTSGPGVIPANADGQNHTTSYTYDLFGNVQTETDPQNRQTEYLYDADNRLVQTEELNTNSDGTAASGATLVTDSRSFDAGGRLAEETNAMGYATCYLYYDNNLTYETARLAAKASTVNGVTTPPACPGSDQATEALVPAGNAFVTAINTYDGAGNLLQTQTSNKVTTTAYGYDDAGRKTTTTLDPTGLDRITTETYFPDGYVKEATVKGPLSSGGSAVTVSDTTYTYTPLGQQLTGNVIDGSSTLTTTTLVDERGLATSSTDPDGNTTYNTYDAAGRLVETQSPQVTSTTYDAVNMAATTAPAYAIGMIGYDTFGDKVESEGPDSGTVSTPTTITRTKPTVYGYDADGNQTSATLPTYTAPSPTGNTLSETLTEYDGDGEPIETIDPTAYNSYVASGSLKKFTAGLVTVDTYNQFGAIETSVATDYTAGTTATTAHTYDAAEQLASTTDPTNAVTSQVYDFMGRLENSTQMERSPTDGSASTQAYVTNYVYGTDGRLASEQSPDYVSGKGGTVTNYDYYPDGSLKDTSDYTGDKTSYVYDAAGRTVRTTGPDGSYIAATYDPAGNQTLTESYNISNVAQSWTQNVYDADGLLVCSEKPLPGTTTAILPQPPTASTITASNYQTACSASSTLNFVPTQYRHDATGLITAEIQPTDTNAADSLVMTYGYDVAGNQTAVGNGNGNSFNTSGAITTTSSANTTYTTYNSWHLPETTVAPATATYNTRDSRETTTSYNADAKPVTITEPGGIDITESYDGYGDLTSETGTGASAPTATRTFGYDLDGRVTSAATSNTLAASATPTSTSTASTSNATNEAFVYDDRGELTSATGNVAGSSTFTYNGDELATSAKTMAGSKTLTTGYTYNTNDLLATQTDPATGSTLTYGYNPEQDYATIGYGTSGDTRTLQYNASGELTSDTLKTTSNTTVAALSYSWDTEGNLTGKTDASGSANTYTYDQADRLTSWTKGTTSQYGGTGTCNNGGTLTCYTYDKDSNRTQVGGNVYIYNSRDELTTDGINTYSYTANGTLQTKQTNGGSSTTYTDDAYGQQLDAGAQAYTYDASGRLVSQQNTGNGATTNLTYEGTGNEVASDGTEAYTRDPSGNLTAATTLATGASSLIWTDLHTDAVATFNPTSSTLTGSKTYDPLGNTLTDTGSATSLTIGYQSEWTDTATGEVNMAARWYNPATGQFLNKDTAANSGLSNPVNANPFAYGNDNPLTTTDPTGHDGDVYGCSITSIKCRLAVNEYDPHPAQVINTMVSAVRHYESARVASERAWVKAHQAPLLNDKPIQVDPLGLIKLPADYKNAKQIQADFGRYLNDVMTNSAQGQYDSSYMGSGVTAYDVMQAFWEECGDNSMCGGYGLQMQLIRQHDNGYGGMLFGAVMEAGGVASRGRSAMGKAESSDDMEEEKLAETESADAAAAELDTSLSDPSESAYNDAVTMEGQLSTDQATENWADSQPDLQDQPAASKAKAPEPSHNGGPASSSAPEANAVSAELTSEATAPEPAKAVAATVEPSVDPAATPVASVPEASLEPIAGAEDPAAQDGCHSFTGATPVLMADGTTKPIDQVKTGDTIANAVPGQSATQDHTVTRVITTYTDHDFVDLTIKSDTHKTTTASARTTSSTPNATTKLALGKRLAIATVTALAAVAATVTSAPSATASSTATQTAPATSAAYAGGALTTTDLHPFYDITQQAFVEAQHLRVGDELQTTTGEAEVTGVRLYHADTVTYDLTIGDLHTYYVVAGNTPVLVHNCGEGLPEGYTSAPFNPADPYSPESVNARITDNESLYPDAIRSAPSQGTGMIGENGTQITSQTAWLEGPYRIDVENPNPGVRSGQMHFQDQSNPTVKYQWDFDNGGFSGMPPRLARQLASNRGFKAGINKGLNWLGESP